MRYLEINNDFHTSGIKEEFGNYLKSGDWDIPAGIFAEIGENSKELENIVSGGKWKIKANNSKCYRIDLRGFQIAKELESMGTFKVKYYSIVLNKYIFDTPNPEDYPASNLLGRIANFFDDLLTKRRFAE